MNPKNQLVGYIRVSTLEQKTDRQLDNMPCDKIFTDHISGSTMDRPALKELLAYVREGDWVVVHSMDRLARNTQDLLYLVNYLKRIKVTIRFVKEGLTFDATDNPMGELMLTIMGSVAQFELSLLKERQREGITKAQVAGKYNGGTKKIKDNRMEKFLELYNSGLPKTKIARELGISTQTIYRYINREKEKEKKNEGI